MYSRRGEMKGYMDVPFLRAEKKAFGSFPDKTDFLKERIFVPPPTASAGGIADWDDEPDRYAVYAEDNLRLVRDEGFSSVLLFPGPLRDIAGSKIFPRLGRNQEENRRQIGKVLERCNRLGLGLYLYFLEPAFLLEDDPFWKEHPDLMGDIPSKDVPGLYRNGKHMVLMCTSTPQVQDYLRQGFADLARGLPGLRGSIHISATELPSHCWSYGRLRVMYSCRDFDPVPRLPACPRCSKRRPEEVIGELAGLFKEGYHSVDENIRVILWNWDWIIYYDDPQAEIMNRLPEGSTFMSDFERGGIKESFGKRYPIDEYSLSYIGPSRKFTDSTALARAKGLDIFAKLQIGASYELASMPNVPLPCNLHQKMLELFRLGVNGTLATWWGCPPTFNTYIFNRFCQEPDEFLDQETFLEQMALEYFGPVDTDKLLEAWRIFSLAFDLFPYTQRFVYWSPLNNMPAYPLLPQYTAKPMDARCTSGKYFNQDMGDRLRDTLIRFTWDEMIARFCQMHILWKQGLDPYETVLEQPTQEPLHQRHRREELSVARAIIVHLRGVYNTYRLHKWKVDQAGYELWDKGHDFPLDRQAREIMEDEIANAAEAIPIYEADSRLGSFHSICNPEMIRRKIAIMRSALGEEKNSR